MTEAMPFLQKYDITFLRPPPIGRGSLFHCSVRLLSLGSGTIYHGRHCKNFYKSSTMRRERDTGEV